MAATRGENLTRQLLSFARTLPLSPTVISPAETVHAIRDVLAGSMHVNIEFQIEVPDDIWPVRVDKSELELALVNLSVNARDAMPFGGGRIVIAAENVRARARAICRKQISGDFVALSVADNGSGIPPDLLSRVVEPFFTTKGSGQRHRPRPVAGLWLCPPVGRHGVDRQRTRPRHQSDGLSAAQPCRGRRAVRRRKTGNMSRPSGRPCWSSRTMPMCAMSRCRC